MTSDTTTKLAYRFALGLEYLLKDRWILGLDFSFINIGSFSSGTLGKHISGEGGSTIYPIKAYEFEDVWIRSVTLGLKYIL